MKKLNPNLTIPIKNIRVVKKVNIQTRVKTYDFRPSHKLV